MDPMAVLTTANVASLSLSGMPHPTGWRPLPWVRVEGTNLVDESGNLVALRGVNFGCWLMLEGWICNLFPQFVGYLAEMAEAEGIKPELSQALKEVGDFDDDVMTRADYREMALAALSKRLPGDKVQTFRARLDATPDIPDEHTLWEVMEKRFGAGGMNRLRNTYRANWITELDLANAKALGLNFIRLPFWYRLLEDDGRPNRYRPGGWEILDRFISLCRGYGIYVMLDLHGAQGSQSPWDHTGRVEQAKLWTESANQARAVALWRALAERYRDEPAVVAYDLMNEPFSAPTLDDLAGLYDRMYKAIREVDERHIIVMEDGYTYEGNMPDPKRYGWRNVMYSNHFYETAHDLAGHQAHADRIAATGVEWARRWGVPIYFGEFSMMNVLPFGMEALSYYLRKFNEAGLHWSPWTFKKVDLPNDRSTWGVYEYPGEWTRPDLHRDSFEDLLATFESLHSRNFRANEEYAAVLRARGADPVVPLPAD
jgi:aryl-phospho-beta-D-glucosidase BglC (GH1 family)